MNDHRLTEICRLIDAANSVDPNKVEQAGDLKPAALVYGERMSAMLSGFRPDAGELLQIAARASDEDAY